MNSSLCILILLVKNKHWNVSFRDRTYNNRREGTGRNNQKFKHFPQTNFPSLIFFINLPPRVGITLYKKITWYYELILKFRKRTFTHFLKSKNHQVSATCPILSVLQPLDHRAPRSRPQCLHRSPSFLCICDGIMD